MSFVLDAKNMTNIYKHPKVLNPMCWDKSLNHGKFKSPMGWKNRNLTENPWSIVFYQVKHVMIFIQPLSVFFICFNHFFDKLLFVLQLWMNIEPSPGFAIASKTRWIIFQWPRKLQSHSHHPSPKDTEGLTTQPKELENFRAKNMSVILWVRGIVLSK